MDIEKLIEQYRQAADKWEKRHPITGTFDLRVQDALRDAATALSTLQAENEKLRADLARVTEELNDLRAQWDMYGGDDGITAIYAELERVKAERDAAINDLEHLMLVVNSGECCMMCKHDHEHLTGPCAGQSTRCDPEWRGIKEEG